MNVLISILKISGIYPIKLYIIVYFDINPRIFIVSHQEHNFAPRGCGFAVRSSLLCCCCSINRCSRSLLLCSRIILVASLKSSIASTSQAAEFSSHSSNSLVGTGSMAMNFAVLRDEPSACLSFIRIFVCLVIFGVMFSKKVKLFLSGRFGRLNHLLSILLYLRLHRVNRFVWYNDNRIFFPLVPLL